MAKRVKSDEPVLRSRNKGLPMTDAQMVFLVQVLGDVRRLWEAGHPRKSEGDLAAWMGGVFKKHVLAPLEVHYVTTWGEVEALALSRDRTRAQRLIKLLCELRERLGKGVGREDVKTPRNLLAAIWTAAKDTLTEKEDLRAVVKEITKGETDSTGRLRRAEALEVLRRMGAPSPTVYRVTEVRRGGRAVVKKVR